MLSFFFKLFILIYEFNFELWLVGEISDKFPLRENIIIDLLVCLYVSVKP